MRKLQIQEKMWLQGESEMIIELDQEREMLHKVPKGEKKLTSLILQPLRLTLLKLQKRVG